MRPGWLSKEAGDALMTAAELLGVAFREGKDTFGRRYVDIDVAGLQHIHEVAVKRGHVEVAQDIRRLLATCQRYEEGDG